MGRKKNKNTNTRRKRLAQARAKGKLKKEQDRKELAESGTLAGIVAMTQEELLDSYIESTFCKVDQPSIEKETQTSADDKTPWYAIW
tara:strand:+ start:872 stop:1132 length:261 start_codon:yes stop_codon:yes gene_type:complete